MIVRELILFGGIFHVRFSTVALDTFPMRILIGKQKKRKKALMALLLGVIIG
jgi:hypothetical protein